MEFDRTTKAFAVITSAAMVSQLIIGIAAAIEQPRADTAIACSGEVDSVIPDTSGQLVIERLTHEQLCTRVLDWSSQEQIGEMAVGAVFAACQPPYEPHRLGVAIPGTGQDQAIGYVELSAAMRFAVPDSVPECPPRA